MLAREPLPESEMEGEGEGNITSTGRDDCRSKAPTQGRVFAVNIIKNTLLSLSVTAYFYVEGAT